ncbi:MAG TPA: endonuclease/exonuclease/phosphatase family protein [Alphaproteobacteria bacterium]|nr:endonuclease/exonuclease/phosphatase family protein [Alphaproteobacteria bacterium]
MNIKIVSFNIEYGASVNKGYFDYVAKLWKYVLPHDNKAVWYISDVINKEDVDIATFMEMDGGSYRTRNINYMNVVSQLTELKNNIFYPVRHMWFGLTNQGNGIATKYTVLSVQNLKLKTNKFIGENRYLSISKVDINGKIIHVLTTQLALGHFSRSDELRQISEYIKNIKGPVIFTGDLNTQQEGELKILEDTNLKRIDTPKTFPSWNPKRRIDYIFHSPDFEVVNSKVLEELKVSDHLPLIAELKLKH